MFQVEVGVCPRCGGESRILGFVTEPEVVRRILAHLERRGVETRAGPWAGAAAARLAWFQAQSEAGLIGRIERASPAEELIVCSDGLRASRLAPDELRALASRVGVEPRLTEVDGSSLFCEIVKKEATEDPLGGKSGPGAGSVARRPSPGLPGGVGPGLPKL